MPAMSCKNLWSDSEAQACIEKYGALGVNEDLALRTYSARLLGANSQLVLHGGGNTSVKTNLTGLLGETIPVLCVKGSGWDLATIEPEGHPAVELEPLKALRQLESLSDEDMVSAQRRNLVNPASPNPSVEALLHAFLPHKFVDHTHATALLALADQPNALEVCSGLYGSRVAFVPYVMPGFDLALAAADAYEQAAQQAEVDGIELEGMVLLQHGLFTFGKTARESYDRMIALVQEAELYIQKSCVAQSSFFVPSERYLHRNSAVVLPIIRGALSRAADSLGVEKRWILALRNNSIIEQLTNHPSLLELSSLGVATPDHVIRTKAKPLVLPPVPKEILSWERGVDLDMPDECKMAIKRWVMSSDQALAKYICDYQEYFDRQNNRVGRSKKPLDSLPRLIIIPGMGLVGVGASSKSANVAADIGEAWSTTLLAAESVGSFRPVNENHTFDLEYWSLEQAKLGKGVEKPFARQVVVVTGGGGAIGAATAMAFAKQGAEVALLDLDGEAAKSAAAQCGSSAVGIQCDVTDITSVSTAFAIVSSRFGGIDIVVSNAGAAWTGNISDLSDEKLRDCFELNFFAHQSIAKLAISFLRLQDPHFPSLFESSKPLGGQLLFNVSKQALNPGPGFGAYGISKSALLALMRQYALEEGKNGVVSNAINADRIRSGLLSDQMIRERSTARSLSEAEYMSGNLLGAEVRADDVAAAFVALAKMQRTTGAVLTVDGGNVAAMVR